jgi:hypothetical protein
MTSGGPSLFRYPGAKYDLRYQLTRDESAAWPYIFTVLQDVWKNEETRFSNLNTRGLGVISASSIVTTLLAFFAKDIFLSSSGQLAGAARTIGQASTVTGVAFLVVTIFVAVFGVLMPGGRDLFGDNHLLGEGSSERGTVFTPGVVLVSESAVKQLASNEYAGMYVTLLNRNERKAWFLSWSYLTFLLGVTVTTGATIYEVLASQVKA